jgi:hypothetical protein
MGKEGGLVDNRRMFLRGLLVAGVVAGIARGQTPRQETPPVIPPDRRPGQEPESGDNPFPDRDKKMLEANDKEIKKKVDRLYELASELKTEMDKTDSSKVLNMNLVKKTEEIEKLAREIRNRSKG